MEEKNRHIEGIVRLLINKPINHNIKNIAYNVLVNYVNSLHLVNTEELSNIKEEIECIASDSKANNTLVEIIESLRDGLLHDYYLKENLKVKKIKETIRDKNKMKKNYIEEYIKDEKIEIGKKFKIIVPDRGIDYHNIDLIQDAVFFFNTNHFIESVDRDYFPDATLDLLKNLLEGTMEIEWIEE